MLSGGSAFGLAACDGVVRWCDERGLARALEPVHATVDGDALVAASVGGVEAPVDQVRVLAARAVEEAVRSAVG